MSALFGRRDDVAKETISVYAQDLLTGALADAMEEAERRRTRRSRLRTAATWITGIGVGVAIGSRLGRGEMEMPDASELPIEPEELPFEPPEALFEATGQRRSRRGRIREAAPKAGAAGAAALGLYLLRRRSSGAGEMIEQATQREQTGAGQRGSVGDVEQPEAVAGGPDDAGRFQTETEEGTEFTTAGSDEEEGGDEGSEFGQDETDVEPSDEETDESESEEF